jgi:hypothetical protein
MVNDIVSNDEKKEPGEESQFPGYPHYPASEDITHPTNQVKKVEADLESMNRSVPGSGFNNAPISERGDSVNPEEEPDDDLVIVPGTEADVTAEDLLILSAGDLDMNPADGEKVPGKLDTNSDTDEELDIPGSELDDDNESIGEEDEENNYYSLGGDNKNSLEEDNQ